MQPSREVVITGIGVVSPIGIGLEAFWKSLTEGRSGVKALPWYGEGGLRPPLGAEVSGFDGAQYVRPRKALKLMSRDIQLAVAATDLACAEAGLASGTTDPERFGVVFGADMIAADIQELVPAFRACLQDGSFDFNRWGSKALADLFPLWMLKYLPNMPACHVGIVHDARGPNNTLTLAEVSSLAALAEAFAVIQRGQADAMLVGGASCRTHPTVVLRNACRELSQRTEDPAGALRPFDADRDGMVYGEGAAVVVLESREHAAGRGAQDKIIATVRSVASAYEPPREGQLLRGDAIRSATRAALAAAGMEAADVGHVNAHGASTRVDDRIEAQAIRDLLGDVPVTAPKSYFGNLGAATGAMELAVSALAFRHGCIPPTLNYARPDPQCPVRVVAGACRALGRPTAIALNHACSGQAVAAVLATAE